MHDQSLAHHQQTGLNDHQDAWALTCSAHSLGQTTLDDLTRVRTLSFSGRQEFLDQDKCSSLCLSSPLSLRLLALREQNKRPAQRERFIVMVMLFSLL